MIPRKPGIVDTMDVARQSLTWAQRTYITGPVLILLLLICPFDGQCTIATADDKGQIRSIIEKIGTSRASAHDLGVAYSTKTTYDSQAISNGLNHSVSTEMEGEFFVKDGHFASRIQGRYNNSEGNPNPISRHAIYNKSNKICTIMEPKTWIIQQDRSSYTDQNSYFPDIAIGWAVTDSDKIFARSNLLLSHFLPECLSHEDWIVADQNEMVGGISCVHISNKTTQDDIWMDPSKSYAVIQRRRVFVSKGRSTNTAIASDLRQVTNTLWLPKRIHHDTTFFAGVSAGMAEKPIGTSTTEVTVSTFSVNKVPASAFVPPEIPAGTQVVNKINNTAYINDTGNNVLDNSITNANRELVGTATPSRRQLMMWLVILNAGILASCVIAYKIYHAITDQNQSNNISEQ